MIRAGNALGTGVPRDVATLSGHQDAWNSVQEVRRQCLKSFDTLSARVCILMYGFDKLIIFLTLPRLLAHGSTLPTDVIRNLYDFLETRSWVIPTPLCLQTTHTHTHMGPPAWHSTPLPDFTLVYPTFLPPVDISHGNLLLHTQR